MAVTYTTAVKNSRLSAVITAIGGTGVLEIGTTAMGTFSATEASDVFGADGAQNLTGAMSSPEIGQDSFAAQAQIVVAGGFNASEAGADTLDASGALFVAGVSGDFAVSESADQAEGQGQVLLSGIVFQTDDADSFASAGAVLVRGEFTASEGLDQAYILGPVRLLVGRIGLRPSADPSYLRTSPSQPARPDGLATPMRPSVPAVNHGNNQNARRP